MKTSATTTALHNAVAGSVSRAGVWSRARSVLLRSVAACLAVVAVQQAASAQTGTFSTGPLNGTYQWLNTANWTGGVISNTISGSFSGNTTFQFSGPHTVNSGSISLTGAGSSVTTFAATSGTQTITFNANTGFIGGQNNYNMNSTWGSSLIWNLSSGTVTYNAPTVRSSFFSSQITGNGTLRIVGDTTSRLWKKSASQPGRGR